MEGHTVEIDWVGRRVADLLSRTRRRFGLRRRSRQNGEKARWWEYLDIPIPEIDSLTAIAVFFAALAAILAAILTWELFLGAVVLFLLEIVVFVPLAAGVLLWRTVLRHPWRVVRDGAGEDVHHLDVTGWRAARHQRDEWQSWLLAGGSLDALGAVSWPSAERSGGDRTGP